VCTHRHKDALIHELEQEIRNTLHKIHYMCMQLPVSVAELCTLRYLFSVLASKYFSSAHLLQNTLVQSHSVSLISYFGREVGLLTEVFPGLPQSL
jgi:hypothetical protein